MEEDFLWKSGMAQYEMRLLLEGALALYEDESSTLLRLAIKNERYEAADAFLLDEGRVLRRLPEAFRQRVRSSRFYPEAQDEQTPSQGYDVREWE